MTENRYAEETCIQHILEEVAVGYASWTRSDDAPDEWYPSWGDAEARIRELIALENCVALEGVVKDG